MPQDRFKAKIKGKVPMETDLEQIRAREAVLNAQVLMMLLLKRDIPKDMRRFLKLGAVWLELAKDFIGKCVYDKRTKDSSDL